MSKVKEPRVWIETWKLKNSRGEYIRHLVKEGVIWMSNEDVEYEDIDRALSTARGHCYIGGLGLGLILEECVKKKNVDYCAVFEIDLDVINAFLDWASKNRKYGLREVDAHGRVWASKDGKISIVYGDATKRFGNNKYDWMYWDIWLEPTKEAGQLMRKCFKNGKKHLSENGILEAWLKPRLEQEDYWE